MLSELESRLLLVANPGGHLQQLKLLNSRLPYGERRLWVTAETPQTRSLLKGEDVVFVPDIASRAYKAMLMSAVPALRLLRKYRPVAVVSTGSALALPYLSAAACCRVPAHYIESATRTDGPSLTGKLLSAAPGIRLYTQHEQWADTHWRYPGSVFDGFVAGATKRYKPVIKVVVSLGTQQRYGFRRLVEKLITILPAHADVVWQTGCTNVEGLPIAAQREIPSAVLAHAVASADVVIAHAGTGIALTAFQAGQVPVLIPRECNFGEHIDDHQFLTADLLDKANLAVVRRVAELDWTAVEQASLRQVRQQSGSSRLVLN